MKDQVKNSVNGNDALNGKDEFGYIDSRNEESASQDCDSGDRDVSILCGDGAGSETFMFCQPSQLELELQEKKTKVRLSVPNSMPKLTQRAVKGSRRLVPGSVVRYNYFNAVSKRQEFVNVTLQKGTTLLRNPRIGSEVMFKLCAKTGTVRINELRPMTDQERRNLTKELMAMPM